MISDGAELQSVRWRSSWPRSLTFCGDPESVPNRGPLEIWSSLRHCLRRLRPALARRCRCRRAASSFEPQHSSLSLSLSLTSLRCRQASLCRSFLWCGPLRACEPESGSCDSCEAARAKTAGVGLILPSPDPWGVDLHHRVAACFRLFGWQRT